MYNTSAYVIDPIPERGAESLEAVGRDLPSLDLKLLEERAKKAEEARDLLRALSTGPYGHTGVSLNLGGGSYFGSFHSECICYVGMFFLRP